MNLRLAVALVVTGVALAGCGYSPGDRALSGGAIGAAGGAAIGAAAGNPLAGALIGGGAGALAGGLTSPSQIDLGRPAWE